MQRFSFRLLIVLFVFSLTCMYSTCEEQYESYSYTAGNMTEDTFIVKHSNVKQTTDTIYSDTLYPGDSRLLLIFSFAGTKKGVDDIHPDRMTVFKSIEVSK